MVMTLEQVMEAISKMKLVDYNEYLECEEYEDNNGCRYFVYYDEGEIVNFFKLNDLGEAEEFLYES